jgi:hypothetical protein
MNHVAEELPSTARPSPSLSSPNASVQKGTLKILYCKYTPVVCTTRLRRKLVFSIAKQRKSMRFPKPNPMFARVLIPIESPETTEIVANKVMTKMSATKTIFRSSLSGSTHPRSCRPAAIWIAPRPRDVQTPATVITME